METERTKGQRWVVSTQDEVREAVVRVGAKANRNISIYTHDLEPGIYDDPDFLEVVKKLVLAKSYARVRVLIAEPSRAIKVGNRLVNMGRRLTTFIEFRHVREDLRNRGEAFCVADATALVYRLQAQRWDGIADTHEPTVAKNYRNLFDEIWLASEVARDFRSLRL